MMETNRPEGREIEMKATKKIRLVLDAVMSALLIAEMLIQFTGVFVHEVLGFALFATLAFHIALSWPWVKAQARLLYARRKSSKRPNVRRIASVAMALALLVSGVVLAVSSLSISNILADAGFDLSGGAYGSWVPVHGIAAYALCALVVVHLAMHWAYIASAMKIALDPEARRKVGAGVYATAALGAGVLGLGAVAEAIPADPGAGSVAVEATGEAGISGSSDAKVSEGSSSNSAAAIETTVAGRKGKKGGHGGSSALSSSSPSVSQAPTDRSQDEGQSTGSYSAGDEDDGGSTPFPGGFCTLCWKGCALSAPQCDKPYEAGLITTSQAK